MKRNMKHIVGAAGIAVAVLGCASVLAGAEERDDMKAMQVGGQLRIMPLGDSITAGYTDNPTWNHHFEFGYRRGLLRRLRDAGMDFVFTRQFKHADVRVDLEKEKSRIIWK